MSSAANVSVRLPAQSTVSTHYPSIAARRRLRIRHPAYDSGNILASFVSTDAEGDVYGVQFHFIHTACAVIANNRFDGWISNSRDATAPKLELEYNAVLPAQDYFFHVMAPIDDTNIDPSLSAEFIAGSYTYPIVPNFRSWPFPHGKVPSSWKEAIPHPAIEFQGSLVPGLAVSQRDVTCRLTNHNEVKELSHVIPSAEKDWFVRNDMSQYSTSETREGPDVVDSESNLIYLREDVHTLWDRMSFSVLPKQRDGHWVLVAHAATTSREVHAFYHNMELQPIRGIPVEYVFSRFVWDLMPKLRGFLRGGERRWLAVQQPNKKTEIAQYTPDDCERLCEGQGRGRSASSSKRKRGADNTSANQARSVWDETGRKDQLWSSSIDSAIAGLDKSTYRAGKDSDYDDEWVTSRKEPCGARHFEESEQALEEALWAEQATDPPRGRKRQRT